MSEPAMTEDDNAGGERRRGRGRDKGPRRPSRLSASSIFKAASAAGQKVHQVTIDRDGKITLDLGNPEVPSGDDSGPKGEQNECDTRLAELEKAARS